jgi:DNA-directed RNA polymerase subunit RPC12/RpoP
MGMTKFRCPECEATLQLRRPLEPGQRIKCPRCAAVVAVPSPQEEVQLPELEPAPRRTPTDRVASHPEDGEGAGDQDQEEWPRRRGQESKGQATSPLLLWGLIGGGGAVVVLAVVLVIVLSGGRREAGGGQTPRVAGKPTPDQEGITWTHRELFDYLKAKGVEFTAEDAAKDLADLPPDEAKDLAGQGAKFRLWPKKKTSQGLPVHVDRVATPQLAQAMAPTLNGFAWGRFVFFIVVKDDRELNDFFASIRNVLG